MSSRFPPLLAFRLSAYPFRWHLGMRARELIKRPDTPPRRMVSNYICILSLRYAV